ncbi:MAG: DoxX family protein [Rhabdochlamydiaceae bacterium]|nr:DoxX family protein [Candidatus Amphrikana amoebophyrae]
MNQAQKIGGSFGRILLALYFLSQGVNQILHWSACEKNFTTDILNWHVYVSKVAWLENAAEALLPFGTQLLALGAFLHLSAGVMLLISWHPRIAASILSLLLIVTNLFTHYFWMVEGYHKEILLQNFMQTIAIIGGLILVASLKKERSVSKDSMGFQSVFSEAESE